MGIIFGGGTILKMRSFSQYIIFPACIKDDLPFALKSGESHALYFSSVFTLFYAKLNRKSGLNLYLFSMPPCNAYLNCLFKSGRFC